MLQRRTTTTRDAVVLTRSMRARTPSRVLRTFAWAVVGASSTAKPCTASFPTSRCIASCDGQVKVFLSDGPFGVLATSEVWSRIFGMGSEGSGAHRAVGRLEQQRAQMVQLRFHRSALHAFQRFGNKAHPRTVQ